MTRLRAALQTADVEHWATGDATLARGRARLIVVLSSGQTRSIALASALADAPSLTIVALVRGATS
jgi:ABC-type sulfate/molybdate transport systems ATPase subunit